jgi:hypothetical protein
MFLIRSKSRFSIGTSVVSLVVLTVIVAIVVSQGTTSRPLPARKVFSAVVPPTMRQCADCHQDVCETFATAPHRLTLMRANSPIALSHFSGKEYTFANGGPTVRFENRNAELWLDSAAVPSPLRVDWIFGSGQHAQTPVSVVLNPDGQTELLQHRVSWYPAGQLGPTPGLEPDELSQEGYYQVSRRDDHVTTMDCFECHVTHLPHDDGRIDEARIITGVGCDRCHIGGKDHMAGIENETGLMEKWSNLTPLESVNRCGECHRRADQLTDAELDPERAILPRFASVGLAMSACFKQQDDVRIAGQSQPRLDCLTCHDPHRPAHSDAQFYVEKCVDCHGSKSGQASECASEPMSSNCLLCHMPKQSTLDELAFTDHWIRVRQPPYDADSPAPPKQQ